MEWVLLKHSNVQPSEIWKKPFYEIEYLIENLKADNDEQQKKQRDEEKKYKEQNSSMKEMRNNFGNLNKQFNASKFKSPKFPGMGSFKM